MNKNPRPQGLAVRFLFTAIVLLSIAGLSGCNPNPNDGGDRKPPPFNADTVRGHIISITEARELTSNFRRGVDSFNHKCSNFKDSLKFDHAEELPADVFNALLAVHNDKQGLAKGIRMYYGRGPDGEIKLLLVPTDSLHNDIIGTIVDLKPRGATNDSSKAPKERAVAPSSSDPGQVVDRTQRCPTICDNGSSGLN